MYLFDHAWCSKKKRLTFLFRSVLYVLYSNTSISSGLMPISWFLTKKVNFLEQEDKNRYRLIPMFPLIFCALCAQKFWRVRSFSGNSPRIKAIFVFESTCRPKKMLFSLNCSGFCARKVYCQSYYCKFMIINIMSVRSMFCVYAVSEICVRARTRTA